MCPQSNAQWRKDPMSDPVKHPTHRAYSLIPRKGKDGGDDEKFWLNIGSVFQHSDGKGMNIVLDVMPRDYQIVLREIKEGEPEPPKKANNNARR